MGPKACLEGANLSPTGLRSQDRPIRRESQYILRYPSPELVYNKESIIIIIIIIIVLNWPHAGVFCILVLLILIFYAGFITGKVLLN
jgi:hypothetical protein